MTPIFCLLLITVPPITPSPVAYILQKNGFNPINHLTSSIIITENLLLTSKFPIFTVKRSETCALAVPNLKNSPEDYIRKNCVNIKNINFSEPDTAFIELEKSITFAARVNTAMIPAVTSITEPLKLNEHCKMVFHERNHTFNYVTSQKLASATVTEGATNTIDTKLASAQQYCVQDNGLPLYCESGVIGILMYESTSTACCVTECKSVSDLKVLKLYTEGVQALLKKYILPT